MARRASWQQLEHRDWTAQQARNFDLFLIALACSSLGYPKLLQPCIAVLKLVRFLSAQKCGNIFCIARHIDGFVFNNFNRSIGAEWIND